MIILDFGWEQMCHQYLPCHCCLGLNTLLAHSLGMSVKISLTYFCKLFKIFYSVIIPPLPLWNLFLQRCPENNTNEQLIRLKYICKHKKHISSRRQIYLIFIWICMLTVLSSFGWFQLKWWVVQKKHCQMPPWPSRLYFWNIFLYFIWSFTSASVASCCWSLIVWPMMAAWFEEHLKC